MAAEHDDRPVTALLLAWGQGDEQARDRLVALVYDELRGRAARHLGRENPGHTLQPTALVNEVYLRLVDQRRAAWKNRAQFFGVAAQMMRRILVDHARRRRAAKRGAGLRVAWDAALEPAAPGHLSEVDVEALDAALGELSALDPRQGQVVELRAFGGLSVEETADVLGLSPATVKRDWAMARAWLYGRLRG